MKLDTGPFENALRDISLRLPKHMGAVTKTETAEILKTAMRRQKSGDAEKIKRDGLRVGYSRYRSGGEGVSINRRRSPNRVWFTYRDSTGKRRFKLTGAWDGTTSLPSFSGNPRGYLRGKSFARYSELWQSATSPAETNQRSAIAARGTTQRTWAEMVHSLQGNAKGIPPFVLSAKRRDGKSTPSAVRVVNSNPEKTRIEVRNWSGIAIKMGGQRVLNNAIRSRAKFWDKTFRKEGADQLKILKRKYKFLK